MSHSCISSLSTLIIHRKYLSTGWSWKPDCCSPYSTKGIFFCGCCWQDNASFQMTKRNETLLTQSSTLMSLFIWSVEEMTKQAWVRTLLAWRQFVLARIQIVLFVSGYQICQLLLWNFGDIFWGTKCSFKMKQSSFFRLAFKFEANCAKQSRVLAHHSALYPEK